MQVLWIQTKQRFQPNHLAQVIFWSFNWSALILVCGYCAILLQHKNISGHSYCIIIVKVTKIFYILLSYWKWSHFILTAGVQKKSMQKTYYPCTEIRQHKRAEWDRDDRLYWCVEYLNKYHLGCKSFISSAKISPYHTCDCLNFYKTLKKMMIQSTKVDNYKEITLFLSCQTFLKNH